MEENDVLRVGSNQMELVDFRMYNEEEDGNIYEGIYGINIAKVKEIIKYHNLVKAPTKDSLLEGMYNLRGDVIPVVSLAKWLNIKEPKDLHDKKIMITLFNNITIGFIVHDAKRIRRVSWCFVKPPSEVLAYKYNNKIVGTINLNDDKVMLILDLESICKELGVFSDSDMKNMIDKASDIAKEKDSVKVLIVDDSSTARKIIRDAVKPLSKVIIEAKDGQEAWDMLNKLYNEHNENIKEALDIIITDVEMPNMDGYRLTKLIKSDSRFKNLPVIMNTSLSGNANIQKAKDVGVDGFCTKFIADDFVKTISEYM